MSPHSASIVPVEDFDSKMDVEKQDLSAATTMSSRPSLDTADAVSCTSYGDEDGNHVEDDESSSEESIAGYENQLVGYSKVLVMAVLLMFALSMGHIAFLFVRGKERQDLENHVSSLTALAPSSSLNLDFS